ncbi:MAG: glycosyltransferase 87 family protein, partial [Victivallales bacterium]|nr:glycosyltransferase 87 family protein [Victivallales bacterium]
GLRHGQSSIWCLWGLLLALTWRNRWSGVAFGAAAVLKYSMLTVLGPLLWVKRHYALCLIGFAVFVLISLYPGLIGFNLIDFYGKYLTTLRTEVTTGANSFSGGGYTMLQLEFFRWNGLNMIGKAIAGGVILWVLFRERGNRRVGMNLLLFVGCLTMLVSYHRMHDLTVVTLILTASLSLFLQSRQWWRLTFGLGFCLLLLLPFSQAMHIGGWLGRHWALDRMFILSSYGGFSHLAPLPALTMIALTVFAGYLYGHESRDVPAFLDNGPEKEE